MAEMSLSERPIAVVGLGTMGAGIAEALARAGFTVVGIERDADALRRGGERVARSLERARAHGQLDAAGHDAVVARLRLGTDLAAVAAAGTSGCGLVIEAVEERLEAKAALLARLDELAAPDTVLATNTSSLSVLELAAGTGRPQRVLGMHWFNPAPVMRLVEVVRTVVTDPDALAMVVEVAEAAGKTPVVTADRAGFIANALLFGYLNDAVRMAEARFATASDIDTAMRLGCGHPMGPLALLDLIGLDTAREILDSMFAQTGDRRHAPAPLLGQLVAAGLLGRKSGRGFHTYPPATGPDSNGTVPGDPTPAAVPAAAAPPSRPVRVCGVVGGGTMALGITQVLLRSGHEVVVRVRRPDQADPAAAGGVRGRLDAALAAAVTRGRCTEDERAAALGRLRTTTDLGDLGDCDILIEAVVEDLAVKRALFSDLDKVARPGAVLATTTSSLPVIECATATSRPRDVVGMHWFNPAPAMRLVEVVPTVLTGAAATETVLALARAAGQQPVRCADRAGFIVNALLFPYLGDAIRMVAAHYATMEDIDTAMTLGCAHPMGPFALADVIGLDVTLAITRSLHEQFREPGLAPAALLEQLVRAGFLGRKTGRGFREHGRRAPV
ncbi:3-hydroxyacyl-CoA dehydrogenase NAD-binding domain-containing protein [Frankia sp. Ag45/Mut15]|uniref:3-hydroxyacyl-CoA dehydrogenase NAD-binding domain-containing protein n=2 Tax=Frankia umida TaxID=573489 RepID=A0ABT0JWD5_9ACTN|nr:3-hydroxyacyl-CoA dehydrogenase NAD-binding domain-containing protein [Frankia umida]MCK9875870.1 3-hydroxyacyl-CoA dehydrogenase NAD-binding domain-containing protein [Frankia umida]